MGGPHAVVVVVLLLAAVACERGDAPRPATYVAEEACHGCHATETATWRGSHHDRAMEEASPATVLADFRDVTVEHGGTSTRFFTRDGHFFANAVGPDGARHDYPVRYTFGVDPLQQYLVELPGGRLQALTVAWDTARKRWFDLYPDERVAPGDPLHWTGLYLNWNAQCAECHSTGLRKNYDAATNTYATTWAALDVGCQACHGPGSAHVDWAAKRGSGDRGIIPAYVRSDARSEVESCAPCHARRHRVSGEDGEMLPFFDHYLPEALRAGLYYPDGQMLDEVYEYGSFVQSRMYARGVRCSDCHDPHSGYLRVEGNGVCTQCHSLQGNPRFPTLARKVYDATSHHMHPEGSAASACVACHMPTRTYMVVDDRHDHSLRIPRPDLSASLGTPNACTSCHRERSDAWAADAIARHHGAGERPTGFGAMMAAAREGRRDVGPPLLALATDASSPAIVRATALELLAAHGEAGGRAIAAAAADPDSLVRATAVGELDRVSPDARVLAASRLGDTIRAVRVEAARVLAMRSPTPVPPNATDAFERALGEYRALQRFEADGPGAHLNLAVLAEADGRGDVAEREYRTALTLDPRFLPARFNLVTLLNAAQRNPEAETILRQGIALAPDNGELHYTLGMLLAEMDRGPEVVEAFGRAATLLPRRARVHYNYGLALQARGRQPDAERALRVAYDLDPSDADVVTALAIHYAQRGRRDEALRFARELHALQPASPEASRLLDALERGTR